jgi:Putative Actinobacterial Holin-X, holin superfamily III
MPTQETDSQGVGAAVKQVAEHTSSIVRLELELAALELRRKVVALGVGIGFGLGAAVMLVFMVAFVYAAIGAALALVMPTWAALLVVAGILLLQALLFAFIALNRIQKGTPPVPEQAIQEAKLTTEALKSNGR